MANRSLFQTLRGALIPQTDTLNDASAPAYQLEPKAALAQLAATGCLTQTYYASAQTQLDRVLELTQHVDTDFIAQTALYARQQGFMKDMPALLCAVLAKRDLDRLIEIFPQVIDNGKMLRNFVQILRSGVTGRKSLGTAPKRLVRQWLERANIRQLIQASVGNSPSLADIVKMVHPRPTDPTREAFYAWLIGKPWNPEHLPEILTAYEAWKKDRCGDVPEVPFQMLTALSLGSPEWSAIADHASWQTTRMNLNTFARHGVFHDQSRVQQIAKRIADPDLIEKARVFPYQLMVAYHQIDQTVPIEIKDALQDAMEIAIKNVPNLSGKIIVCTDVSGSMSSPITGYRPGASSRVRCIDVAALITAAILRKNRDARVMPFEVSVIHLEINSRDSVMTNAEKLSKIGGGGTDCSAPLAQLNRELANPDLVIFISDNESWADSKTQRGTALLHEWQVLKQRNPNARLVCIDLIPNQHTQAPNRKDILNIGGFSDAVFKLLASFANGTDGSQHWIQEIERQALTRKKQSA